MDFSWFLKGCFHRFLSFFHSSSIKRPLFKDIFFLQIFPLCAADQCSTPAMEPPPLPGVPADEKLQEPGMKEWLAEELQRQKAPHFFRSLCNSRI